MTKGKSGCSKVREKALVIDLFGEPFQFYLPNQRRRYTSLVGAIMTLITVIAVGLYAVYKWQVLFSLEETRIQPEVKSDYFTNEQPNSTFTAEDGLQIAAGFYSVSDTGQTYGNEDGSYGKISFFLDIREGDELTSVELETEVCDD